ncbi:MAG: clan AA aspartic protease [Planctomycetales bacterium]
MILGKVINGFEAVVKLTVEGRDRSSVEISAIVDTGFTGELTLAPAQIAMLRLAPCGGCKAMLADGRTVESNVYRATVVWDGAVRRIRVVETANDALVGMRLLRGCRLQMDVIANGEIAISALTRRD